MIPANFPIHIMTRSANKLIASFEQIYGLYWSFDSANQYVDRRGDNFPELYASFISAAKVTQQLSTTFCFDLTITQYQLINRPVA